MSKEETNKECGHKKHEECWKCSKDLLFMKENNPATPSLEERVDAVLKKSHSVIIVDDDEEGFASEYVALKAAVIKLLEGEKQGKLSVGGTLDGAYLIGKKEERQRIKEAVRGMKVPEKCAKNWCAMRHGLIENRVLGAVLKAIDA